MPRLDPVESVFVIPCILQPLCSPTAYFKIEKSTYDHLHWKANLLEAARNLLGRQINTESLRGNARLGSGVVASVNAPVESHLKLVDHRRRKRMGVLHHNIEILIRRGINRPWQIAPSCCLARSLDKYPAGEQIQMGELLIEAPKILVSIGSLRAVVDIPSILRIRKRQELEEIDRDWIKPARRNDPAGERLAR